MAYQDPWVLDLVVDELSHFEEQDEQQQQQQQQQQSSLPFPPGYPGIKERAEASREPHTGGGEVGAGSPMPHFGLELSFEDGNEIPSASNNEDVRGWADKLYEHQSLPGKHLPAQRIPCPAAAAGTSDAAVATTPGWAEHAAGGTARKKGGANTRPTA
ncbi:unnamed protein product, partial [Pylaiella littoralis]